MTLHPLVLPHVVSRSAGGICILPQRSTDHSCGSAAGFQHALSHLISHPSPVLSRTTYQVMGQCLRCGRSICVALSYKYGHSSCSFPLYSQTAGSIITSDLPGWPHLSSFWSTPAPTILAQVHPSLPSWEQITHQPDSTEKITPELRNTDCLSSGFNFSPPQRNTAKTTWRAKKTGNGEAGRRGQPEEQEQGAPG